MTGGPAELEGVAADGGKATDCSEEAAELAVLQDISRRTGYHTYVCHVGVIRTIVA